MRILPHLSYFFTPITETISYNNNDITLHPISSTTLGISRSGKLILQTQSVDHLDSPG